MWYWNRYSVQKDIKHDLDQKHKLLLLGTDLCQIAH